VSHSFRVPEDLVPTRVTITAKRVGDDGNLQIDINDDGETIFDSNPVLYETDTSRSSGILKLDRIREGSLLTLDVDRDNGASDVTVQLDLDTA
tara:strand:+ start:289 stop:567 length:279 start_codon:yes stop_codon:yes gene_type:complete